MVSTMVEPATKMLFLKYVKKFVLAKRRWKFARLAFREKKIGVSVKISPRGLIEVRIIHRNGNPQKKKSVIPQI